MITENDLKLLSTIILKTKENRGLTWDQLAQNLPVAGNSLRMSFKRENVKYDALETICNDLEIDINEELNLIREQRNKDYIQSQLIGKFEYDFYRKNYDDGNYIAALPTYLWRRKNTENQNDTSDYRTFEIINNEMNDATYRSLLIGDFVLCKLIPRNKLKTTLKPDAIIGFLHWEQGVSFRLVKSIDLKKKQLLVTALQEPESVVEINFAECAEFYEIIQLDRQTRF